MGLTVHYSFRYYDPSARQARALVEKLHRRTLKLPFFRVGQILRYARTGPRVCYDPPDWFRSLLDLAIAGVGGQFKDTTYARTKFCRPPPKPPKHVPTRSKRN